MKQNISLSLRFLTPMLVAILAGCSRPATGDEQHTDTAEAPPQSAQAMAASPFIDLQPRDDGFVAIPVNRITDKALYVNIAKDGEPTVQLIAIHDGAGRARVAFNTCQACNPSPRAFFAQRGDSLVCQNCGNAFGPEAVGTSARGCNPAAIPGVVEEGDFLLVPAAPIESARPAFTYWTGPVAP